MFRSYVLLASLLLIPTLARAEDKTIEPEQTWKGSVADAKLLGKPPTAIVSEEAWKAQWKAWMLAGETPKVDFSKQLVIVQTTVGSQLRVTTKLTDKGDLKILGLGTLDFGTGFRYVIHSIPRAGIKTVNGAALPEEKKDDKEKDKDKATVTGQVTGPDKELEAGLVAKIQLLDVSLADAAAKVLGEQIVREPKAFPFDFTIPYDAAAVKARGPRYAIGVRIEKDGKLRYINDTSIPVLSDGAGSKDVKANVIKIK